MPVCQFCGEEVDKVYQCKRCDILFCGECGSVSDSLCLYCLEEDEDNEDEDYEEDYEEEED